MNSQNKTLVASITFAGVIIAGSLVFLGTQIGSANNNANIQGQIARSPQEQAQPKTAKASEDNDAFMGDKNAPITIIEFSDYQCPFCRKFYNETLPQIKEKYINTGKVKLVYRDFPLSFHKDAAPAAVAAECARDQKGNETYFAYHDLIFEGQNKLGQGTVNIPRDSLISYAQDLNLNMSKFEKCLDEQKYKQEVNQDLQDGIASGVEGTPGFFINGISVEGAQPFETFDQIIAELLKEI